MRAVYDVATVRQAEEQLLRELPDGALMARAATGLADTCSALLRDVGSGVAAARVVLLVGSGNNGGDALHAGALLARRGASVTAVRLGPVVHREGERDLLASGGTCVDGVNTLESSDLIADADLVIDGIVGLGGSGALRPLAAEFAQCAAESGALIVAVDLPSGTAADTGAVADAEAVVEADVTVTFGCLKPGLLLAPARELTGAVTLVDIGLDPLLPPARLMVLEPSDVASCLPEPTADDYKYSRGVVGIAAGSRRYPGAAYLATGSARLGNAGMVHLLDRGDGLAERVIQQFWDVVTSTQAPASLPRVRAWAVGPGIGDDASARDLVRDVLATDVPVVLDADALRVLSRDAATVLRGRQAPAVVTPHVGEFAALGFVVGHDAESDRLARARDAARDLGAVVVLKGPGTVIAAPGGLGFIDVEGGAELGTAGSGDVLTGLMAAMLASWAARDGVLDHDRVAFVAAGAVALHGIAGRLAAEGGRPVTAMDLVEQLPAAVAFVRRGSWPDGAPR